MKKTFLTGLVMLTCLLASVTLAWANSLSPHDPDQTGYPYINIWKAYLNRDVPVFLNDQERNDLTLLRVNQSVTLQTVLNEQNRNIQGCLTPMQQTQFAAMVATQDPEDMATWNDEQWLGYECTLNQELHLDGRQTASIHHIIGHMRDEVTGRHAAFVSNFDEQVASAQQRSVAEHNLWDRGISTAPER